jgi:hypothetical protein
MHRIANCSMGKAGCSAPIQVVPGRLAVARVQMFGQVWRQLLKWLRRVEVVQKLSASSGSQNFLPSFPSAAWRLLQET